VLARERSTLTPERSRRAPNWCRRPSLAVAELAVIALEAAVAAAVVLAVVLIRAW